MLLIIDNYDSFTYNLYQYFCELGADVQVKRNDAVSLSDIEQLSPSHLVISRVPARRQKPVFHWMRSAISPVKSRSSGVSRASGYRRAFGAQVVKARKVMHGKTTAIHHNQQGVFKGLNRPLTVTRYHSLVIAPKHCLPRLRLPHGVCMTAMWMKSWGSAIKPCRLKVCSSIRKVFSVNRGMNS